MCGLQPLKAGWLHWIRWVRAARRQVPPRLGKRQHRLGSACCGGHGSMAGWKCMNAEALLCALPISKGGACSSLSRRLVACLVPPDQCCHCVPCALQPPLVADGSGHGAYHWDQGSATVTVKLGGGGNLEIRTVSGRGAAAPGHLGAWQGLWLGGCRPWLHACQASTEMSLTTAPAASTQAAPTVHHHLTKAPPSCMLLLASPRSSPILKPFPSVLTHSSGAGARDPCQRSPQPRHQPVLRH